MNNASIDARELRDVLKKRFGYPGFRPGQEDVVRDILQGGDRLVVLPTGGGKSLCYLLPAFLFPGKTLVISPLIALMEDQALRADSAGLRAVIWNRETRRGDLENASIIFVSPEKVVPQKKEIVSQLGVWHLVIDEAHCVEDWGGSFRPLYTQLARLRSYIAPKSVSVFTASAGAEQRASLIKRLGLREATSFVHGFDRPNIDWHCHQTDFPLLAAIRLLEHSQGRAIVYCRTRLETSRTAAALRASGLDARPFHAGMRRETRMGLQKVFIEGSLRILCATSAFGMGVDVPSVRTVIHLGLPSSCNAYYQESGRAGRDGEPALAVLFSKPDGRSWVDGVQKRNRVLRRLITGLPGAWSEAELARLVRNVDGGQDPAAIVAFLLHHGICRSEAGGRLHVAMAARAKLVAALESDAEVRRREEAWAQRYVASAGECRRRQLVGRFEDVSALVCSGCDRCGSRFDAMIASVLEQTGRETKALLDLSSLSWEDRPGFAGEEKFWALDDALRKAR